MLRLVLQTHAALGRSVALQEAPGSQDFDRNQRPNLYRSRGGLSLASGQAFTHTASYIAGVCAG